MATPLFATSVEKSDDRRCPFHGIGGASPIRSSPVDPLHF